MWLVKCFARRHSCFLVSSFSLFFLLFVAPLVRAEELLFGINNSATQTFSKVPLSQVDLRYIEGGAVFEDDTVNLNAWARGIPPLGIHQGIFLGATIVANDPNRAEQDGAQ